MKDQRKTKKVLIEELQECRKLLESLNTPAKSSSSLNESADFENLIHSVFDAVLILDDKGSILFFNKAVIELVRLRSREIPVNPTVFEFIQPGFKKQVRQHLDKIKKDNQSFLAEYKIVTADNSSRWVEGHVSRIQFRRNPAVLVTLRDITNRKNAEETINSNKAELNALLENTADSIWLVDRKFRITWLNSTFRNLFYEAYGIDLKAGDNILEVSPHFLRSVWKKRYRRALNGEGFSVEERYRFNNHDMDVEISLNPIRTGHEIRGVSVTSRDITERKRIERGLRDSEVRFRTLVENVPSIAVHGYNCRGEVIFWNPACERIYQYSKDEAKGRRLEDLLLDGDNRTEIMNKIEKIIHDDYVIPLRENSYRKKDGTIIHVLSSNVVLRDGSGDIIYYFLDIDLTRLKSVEAALKESEMKYRLLAETARDIIAVHDMNGDFTYMNKAGLEAAGFKPDEVKKKNVTDLISLNHLEKMYDKWFRNLKNDNNVFLYETEMMTGRGLTIPVEINSSLIHKNGSPSHILLVIRDISERKRVENEMNMLGHAIKSISECVSVTDMNDKILFVNDAFLKTYGYDWEDLIGKSIDVVRSPENPEEVVQKILPETLQGSWQGELVNRRKSGEDFHIFLSTSIIRDDNHKPVALIGVSRDITERKKLEAQYRQAQKMEAIGRLAGGVAHDFNNILTIIKGYTELLLSRVELNDILRNYALQIDKAGERAGELTRQLLAFSRKQILQPKVLNLNALIKDMEQMMQRLIGEDLELITLLDAELGNIQADPGQIQQLIMNMIINSRDAMTGNGKIILETENTVLDGDYIRKRSMVRPGHYVKLTISDTGMGIQKEIQDHIFEPFFTTKEEGKGTGLGLATVYGIVKQSGGYIFVYSEPGMGTTFKVYLPRIDQDIDKMNEEEYGDEDCRGNETVLVVEDEDEVRDLICETLRKYDYNVLEAPHGGIALSVCEEYKETIHLVITDIVMPHMSGQKFVEEMVKHHPESRVLYISGYTSAGIIQKNLLEPDMLFLQKPFSMITLLRKIRHVLDLDQS
ncbi:MAG: PAS domain-containing sensor histidine kinase [Calditrichaeota bacterium]|nr:PAS domain S-box protein [Calditrichota bacterium]RQV93152.1 MAG: PAS domain-containing sensor histidine kinase [bacterium]RQW04560.1 MAG: PAS domain-containing sensor histidine kinase [Calditrichota bacterium]